MLGHIMFAEERRCCGVVASEKDVHNSKNCGHPCSKPFDETEICSIQQRTSRSRSVEFYKSLERISKEPALTSENYVEKAKHSPMRQNYHPHALFDASLIGKGATATHLNVTPCHRHAYSSSVPVKHVPLAPTYNLHLVHSEVDQEASIFPCSQSKSFMDENLVNSGINVTDLNERNNHGPHLKKSDSQSSGSFLEVFQVASKEEKKRTVSTCRDRSELEQESFLSTKSPQATFKHPGLQNTCIFADSSYAINSMTRGLTNSEFVPFVSTMHSFVHSSYSGGLRSYTLFLDASNVLIAKIWTDDMVLVEDGATWRYTFYSFKGNDLKTRKAGWKYWKKEKVIPEPIASMKVSSILCSSNCEANSAKSTSVVSEFVLSSDKPLESLRTANHILPYLSREAVSALCMSQNLLPAKLAVSLTAKQRKQPHKENRTSVYGNPEIPHRHSVGEVDQVASVWQDNLDGGLYIQSSNTFQSELAAIVIKVPLDNEERQTLPGFGHYCKKDTVHKTEIAQEKIFPKEMEANITVILPAGNHGKPYNDLKGPSPLIDRWKKGGQCDCKGWDLGCGLMILGNDNIGFQSHKKPLTIYKEKKDQQHASLRLAPFTAGFISLEFTEPLSPLQAFAIAVAILHGRDPVLPGKDVISTKEDTLTDMASLQLSSDFNHKMEL